MAVEEETPWMGFGRTHASATKATARYNAARPSLQLWSSASPHRLPHQPPWTEPTDTVLDIPPGRGWACALSGHCRTCYRSAPSSSSTSPARC